MTDEEINKFIIAVIGRKVFGVDGQDYIHDITVADLRQIAHLAIEAERAACAKVADDAERRKWDMIRTGGKMEGFGAVDIAATIRKRGESQTSRT